jgi:uncharacterized protein
MPQRVPAVFPVLAVVSAGGVAGSLARYGIQTALPHPPGGFPWATFGINVSGSLLIGVLMTLIAEVGRGRPGRVHHLLRVRGRHPAGRRRHRAGVPGRDPDLRACRGVGRRRRHPLGDPFPREVSGVKIEGPALRLTVYVGESDRWHHRPLYTEIVHRAHRAGLAGATVLRGVEGYGASNHIHTTRLLSLSEDLPVAVIIIDAEDAIRAFLPQLEELTTEGLVVVDRVEVIRRGREP